MKIMLLAAGLALLSVSAAQAIDCTKAATDLDYAICRSPDLTKADDAMNAAYQAALKAVGPKMAKVLKADAVAWAGSRYDNCTIDTNGDPAKQEDIPACLLTDTQKRTAYLTGTPLAGPGFGETLIPQSMAGADQVYDEYLRFATPRSAAAKAFNAAVDKWVKNTRMAKTSDQVSDWLQLELDYASPALISADLDLSQEAGYAHAMMSNQAINIDGRTGRELELADLLDGAGTKSIETNCADQLKDYIAAGEEGSDQRAENIKDMVDDLSSWSFGAGAATLHFTEYGDDPYHICTIGYGVLRPLAKASFPLPN